MTIQTQRPSRPSRLKPLAAALIFAFAGQAMANPKGATVVKGNVSITTSGNTMTVTNSPGAIINWDSFSIAANEVTYFAQQSASSTVLNRVTGSDPSSILGSLQSNGHVWLINPNGIIFGAGARIDVAGLVASTLNITDQDFSNGVYKFTGTGGEGAIENAGNISASGGPVLLFAPDVENSGIITSPNGEVILAAGHSVELADSSNPALRVTITAGGEAVNLGQIIAEGGSVGMVGNLVTQSGMVSASSATAEGGRIFLRGTSATTLGKGSVTEANGTQGGEVSVEGGMLSVSGTLGAVGSEGAGGTIHALGESIELAGAMLDASGRDAGGTVLVGGDYQGKNADIRNAQVVRVDADSNINVSATENGNGGMAVVWSDGHTEYLGNILARGGENGGDGGMVEVSGKETLDFRGMVDAGASAGEGGSLLLDPKNIYVGTIAGDVSVYDAAYFNVDPAFTYQLVPGQITSILNTGTDVTLQANNDIVVTQAIIANNPSGNGGSLTMQAGRSIMVNADIYTDNGSLYLHANDNSADSLYRDAGAAEITIASGVTLDAGSGELVMDMQSLSTAGAINSAGTLVGTTIYISSDTDLTLNGQFNVSGSNVWVSGEDINLNADFVGLVPSMTLGFTPDAYATGGALNVMGVGTTPRLLDMPGGQVLVDGDFNVDHALAGGDTAMLDVQGSFSQASGADITGFGHVGISQLTGDLAVGNIVVDVPAGGYSSSSPAGWIALESLGGDITQQAGTTLSGAGVGAVSYDGSVLLTEANPTGVVLGQAGVDFHFNSVSPIEVISYNDGIYAFSGIYAGNDLSLTSSTGDIVVNAPVSANGELVFSTPTLTMINSLAYTGSSYVNDGTIEVGMGGYFQVDGNFTNSGDLFIGGGYSQMLVHQDFINNSGATVVVQGSDSVINPPALARMVISTYTLFDIDGTLTNAGTLTVEGYGAEAGAFQGVTNQQGGSINVQDEAFFAVAGGTFSNSGSLLVSNAYVYTAGLDNTQSGSIAVNGGTAGLYSMGSITSAGTITLNKGYLSATDLTINGGLLAGSGGIQGNVVNNGGTISPGSSAGELSIMGDLTLGSGSTLVMELGDPADPAANDKINVSGLFTMGGALELSTISGYIPAVGDTFTLFVSGSEAGSFASMSLPLATVSLSGGLLEILTETTTTTVGTTISQVIVDSSTQVSTGSGLLFTVTPIDGEDDDDKQEGKNTTRMICS